MFNKYSMWIIYGWLFVFMEKCLGNSPSILLLDKEWKVRNSNQSILISAQVPGGIYTDLMAAGIINDPYFRNNDDKYRWIGRENWEYYTTFEISTEMITKAKISLVAHGLDTISNIYINNNFIGNSSNMFVRENINIKSYVQKNNNTIKISFLSPVIYAKTKSNEHIFRQKYNIPPICPSPIQNGECHVNFIRKIQSSFSWDWGPSFPSTGIWKNIEIEAYNDAIIRDITVITTPINSDNFILWNLNLTVYYELANSRSVIGTLTVLLNNTILFTELTELPSSDLLEGNIKILIDIPKDYNIKLWWPNGYGKQPLYNLTIVFNSTKEEFSCKNIRIGFRKVELIQEEIHGSKGLSFYFRINGVTIFAKGSNWIPADSFPERISKEYLQELLQSTKDAHMNMLRVWGGGMYEQDKFYEFADEMGILIWQDLMFAVALYPVTIDFLITVSTEIWQQIRRLQHHPCIAIWAGNNENEVGLAQKWWPLTYFLYDKYKEDYIKLYVDTIREIVIRVDNSRPFLVSSPSNGKITEKNGWISSNPQDHHYGDIHFYNYASDGWDWKIYPRARFVSEYGFQSYPSFETFSKVSLSEDWIFPFSKFLFHRQHHLFGGLEILKSIYTHLFLPNKKCGKKAFKDMLYLSQITQAISIKTETEFYRRSQNEIINGEGRTMGALYWQLNDIWQAPTWSSIEYEGRWKMLHYYAVNFFNDVLVSPYKDEENITVSFISDRTDSLLNLTLKVNVYHWSSLKLSYEENILFNQSSQSSQIIFTVPEEKLLQKSKCNEPEECVLSFCVNDKTGKQLGPCNDLFLSPLNKVRGLQKANITIVNVHLTENTPLNGQIFSITLKTDGIAVFVWLETDLKGRFSSNGFLLLNSKTKLFFFSKQTINSSELYQKLHVHSLMDICT